MELFLYIFAARINIFGYTMAFNRIFVRFDLKGSSQNAAMDIR